MGMQNVAVRQNRSRLNFFLCALRQRSHVLQELRSRMLHAWLACCARLVEPFGKGARGTASNRFGFIDDGIVVVSYLLHRHMTLGVGLGELLEEGLGRAAVHVLLVASSLQPLSGALIEESIKGCEISLPLLFELLSGSGVKRHWRRPETLAKTVITGRDGGAELVLLRASVPSVAHDGIVDVTCRRLYALHSLVRAASRGQDVTDGVFDFVEGVSVEEDARVKRPLGFDALMARQGDAASYGAVIARARRHAAVLQEVRRDDWVMGTEVPHTSQPRHNLALRHRPGDIDPIEPTALVSEGRDRAVRHVSELDRRRRARSEGVADSKGGGRIRDGASAVHAALRTDARVLIKGNVLDIVVVAEPDDAPVGDVRHTGADQPGQGVKEVTLQCVVAARGIGDDKEHLVVVEDSGGDEQEPPLLVTVLLYVGEEDAIRDQQSDAAAEGATSAETAKAAQTTHNWRIEQWPVQ